MTALATARDETNRKIRETVCAECGAAPRRSRRGGYPVAECKAHPWAPLEERAMSDETALVPHTPSAAEVDVKVSELQSVDFRFLSGSGASDDNKPGLIRLLAEGSLRLGLDPLRGEVMLFQGRVYPTIDGRIKMAKRTGRLEWVRGISPAQDPSLREQCRWVQEQTPLLEDGSEEKLYFGAAQIFLKGWREPQTYIDYITESERRERMEQEKRGKYFKGKYNSPIITNTLKMAEKRAMMRALRFSGAYIDDMSDIEREALEAEYQVIVEGTRTVARGEGEMHMPQLAEPPQDAHRTTPAPVERMEPDPDFQPQEPAQATLEGDVVDAPPPEDPPAPDDDDLPTEDDAPDVNDADPATLWPPADFEFTVGEGKEASYALQVFGGKLGYKKSAMAQALLESSLQTLGEWFKVYDPQQVAWLLQQVHDEAKRQRVALHQRSDELEAIAMSVHAANLEHDSGPYTQRDDQQAKVGRWLAEHRS